MGIKRVVTIIKSFFSSKTEIVGEVANKKILIPVYFKSNKFGKTTFNPGALRIVVDSKQENPLAVGKLVNDIYYKNSPPFEFNVCFSCGASSLFRGGKYADPYSIWFNVFLGYYEISVPKSKWSRPFGYNEDGSYHAEELKNIGKSDWNYFSAYMYGVPEEAITPLINADCEFDGSLDKVKIGESYWGQLEFNNLTVVSAYESKNGEKLVNNDKIFSPLWRLSFGRPKSRECYKESFFPVNIKVKVFISFTEEYDENFGEVCYKTHMFGGMINLDYPKLTKSSKSEAELVKDNEEFLAVQMESIKSLIEKHYPHLGFKASV